MFKSLDTLQRAVKTHDRCTRFYTGTVHITDCPHLKSTGSKDHPQCRGIVGLLGGTNVRDAYARLKTTSISTGSESTILISAIPFILHTAHNRDGTRTGQV